MIQVLQTTLKSALGHLSGATSPRSSLPVLANVLFRVENGRLTMAATDLSKVLVLNVSAKIPDGEQWSITVPAKTIGDLAGAMVADVVELTFRENTVMLDVKCGRTKASIKGIPGDEFPALPAAEGDWRVTVSDAPAFKTAVSRCTFAAARDSARETLTGVLFSFGATAVDLAATDGFRLSLATLRATAPPSEKAIIVPADTLAFLLRLMGDKGMTIILPSEHGRILFQGDDWLLSGQLINGNYPDYTPIIPKNHKTRVVVGTADMQRAVKTAGIFAKASSDTVRIEVQPGDEITPGALEIRAQSAELGDSNGRLDATADGGAIEAAFSAAYLAAALGVMDEPQTAIELTTPLEPAVLRPVGDDDFKHIIMPMHFGR